MDFLENTLPDPDDIDALLNLASLARKLAADGNIPEINRLLTLCVSRSNYEAFSWITGILQEELENPACPLPDFECPLGKSIPDYDALIQTLGVNLSSPKNSVETVLDEHGEVASFFNILAYETSFSRIRLISAENFDTRDNDFVLYKLAFSRATA